MLIDLKWYHTTTLAKLRTSESEGSSTSWGVVNLVRARYDRPMNEKVQAKVEYGKMRRKEMAWLITKHGPLNSYFRFNLAKNNSCRTYSVGSSARNKRPSRNCCSIVGG